MSGHADALLAATSQPRPELLDPGTRVTAVLGGRTVYGVVQPYDQRHSIGTFPVCFEGLWWRKCLAYDVTVVARPEDPR